MRLADMELVHPDQIEDKCSLCGETVGIYPSGQNAMKRYPDIEVVCHVCETSANYSVLADGALLEPFQSVRKK
jgi:hypothetical protein